MLAASAAALTLGAATPADMKGDVEIVRRALRLHPGLYRYATPTEVDARLAALETAFVGAPTLEARYLVLSRFLATIRCGHSYCNFFNQKKAVAQDLFGRKTRLPFHFIWLDGRMVVTGDPSGLGLPRGAEVTTINGRPARDMLTTLLPYARADGHNEAKRVSLLGVSGSDSIEFFDVFQGLVFGPPVGGEHRLTLRRAAGESFRLELPAIGLDQRRAQTPKRDYIGAEPVWDWAVRRDGVAVLTMPSWALYDSKWDWRAWLDDRLDSPGGAAGLVIDLRQNEGGQDCGDAILARLAADPIERLGAERRVRFRRTPADLDPYLDTWDNSFRTLGVDAVPAGEGFYRLQGERGDDRILPTGRRLDIKVAALIGPTNSSATFQFADKARGLVKLFGQATGGNQRGINGGCFFFVRLPASGIEFDLPLIGYFPPGHPPDAGIKPDVAVPISAADLAAGYDRTLETAARWILS
ncbi:MAG: peptidase S41 [Proteobacteria bacterium]|nr:peptidase S41 [Pseudomonadota bacterium]